LPDLTIWSHINFYVFSTLVSLTVPFLPNYFLTFLSLLFMSPFSAESSNSVVLPPSPFFPAEILTFFFLFEKVEKLLPFHFGAFPLFFPLAFRAQRSHRNFLASIPHPPACPRTNTELFPCLSLLQIIFRILDQFCVPIPSPSSVIANSPKEQCLLFRPLLACPPVFVMKKPNPHSSSIGV